MGIEYRKYTKEFGDKYIKCLLKKHNIKAYKKSKTSSGHALIGARKIQIPDPTDIDRFAVCLHEVKHITDGYLGKSFLMEFYCDMYALSTLKSLKFEHSDWEHRMRWHSLDYLATAYNKGLPLSRIPIEIKEFFKEVDFEKWKDKNVFVYYRKLFQDSRGYEIVLIEKISLSDIKILLGKQNLVVDKSMRDDSTYGMYVVKPKGSKEINGGDFFKTLPQIVKHYKLTKNG